MSDHANLALKAHKMFLYFVIFFSGAIDEEGRLEESGAVVCFERAVSMIEYLLEDISSVFEWYNYSLIVSEFISS